MYIFKNALLNIRRNIGRNILIGIIIMVIAFSSAITLSIRNSADKIVKSYEEKYQLEATIGMNRNALTSSFKENAGDQEAMIESFNNLESLTQEQIELYGDSEYVLSYYYTLQVNMDALDIEEATDSLVRETTTVETNTEIETEVTTRTIPGSTGDTKGGNFPNEESSPGETNETTNRTTKVETKTTHTTEEIKNMKAENGAFTVVGYSSYESMTEFISGSYTITEGLVSSDFNSNTCVISEELATLNELSVGDIITLVSPNDEDITYELEITGFFTENTDSSQDMTQMFSSSVNTIITNSNVVNDLLESDTELAVSLSPTYILKSTDIVDDFIAEVEEKGLSEYYTISTNLETVESATKSIVNVKNFATTFLTLTLIIGAVVLFVIHMINIRERKYEIGVLRTIGMRKSLLISQFVLELLAVGIIALLVGAGIGSLGSVSIANQLLQNEIENSQEEVNVMNENFGGGEMFDIGKGDTGKINGVATIEQIDTIEAIVDFKVLLQLLGIGVFLTVISSLSAMIAIARFSPLTILKERS